MVVRDQLDHKKRADLTSIGTWRENYTELSIQDIHTFNQERGGKGPHNSQQHKLEKNTIEPYLQVFKSLAAMFYELANEENFIYVKSEKLRNRLKNAQPYLTHDGRVPTMIDLIEIFEGIQPVNPLYKSTSQLDTKFIDVFVKQLQKSFRDIAEENMFSNKECWEALLKTEAIKDVEEKELLKIIQDTLRGESSPTVDQVTFALNKYKACPACVALRELSNNSLSKKLEKTHSDLLELVL